MGIRQSLNAVLVPVLVLAMSSPLIAMEQVLEVRDVDRILVQYRQLPVFLSLANVEIPAEGPVREQALARISELISGQGVQVFYDDSYGHDESGVPRVYLRRGQVFVNVILVSEGLARYVASDNPTSYERLLANAASMAERDGVGLWADASGDAAAADPVAAAPAAPEPAAAGTRPAPAPPAQRAPAGRPAAGATRYASELNGTYYYPEGHPSLANVHRNRLIFYPDEEAAVAAGKMRAPEMNQAAMPVDDGTVTAADRTFEKGEQLYARAQAMPATPERDRAYTEALGVLTEAVQRYSNLVEQKPNDNALGEKLRRAMQLRYGAMKMRRSR